MKELFYWKLIKWGVSWLWALDRTKLHVKIKMILIPDINHSCITAKLACSLSTRQMVICDKITIHADVRYKRLVQIWTVSANGMYLENNKSLVRVMSSAVIYCMLLAVCEQTNWTLWIPQITYPQKMGFGYIMANSDQIMPGLTDD